MEIWKWLSIADNISHGFESGLFDSIQHRIRLEDCNGAYIEFPSMAAASRYLGRNHGYLHNAMKRGLVIRDVYGEIYRVVPF